MRLVFILFMLVFLSGCDGSYGDFAAVYGSSFSFKGERIPADTIIITGLQHDGCTSANNLANIKLSSNAIKLGTFIPFFMNHVIPASDIDYCGITNRGWKNHWVYLIIGKTGTKIEIKNKKEMLDWCWKNRIPVISYKDAQAWEYEHKPLPPKEKYKAQLESREEYFKQARQSYSCKKA